MRPMLVTLRTVGLRVIRARTDRTRHGWHVIFWITRRLESAETVALQACLGSDRNRETFNLMRVIAIRQNAIPQFFARRWNLLYERKV